MTTWLRRRDRADWAFVVMAVVAAATLLRLGLGLTFFADDWSFITTPSLADPASWFTPHNEHWSTLPILAQRLLVETVGIGSYVPYLALVAVLHLIVAALVYVLARAKAGALVGLGAAIIVLFLGSGFENLFWAFQLGFVGSTAAGLAAMALLDGSPSRARVAAAMALLIAGLMCSGMGVTFMVVVAVELALDAPRRRFLPALVIPTAVYAAWYATIGHQGIAAVRPPFTLEALLDAPPAIVAGLGNAVGSVVGVGPAIGVWVGLVGIAVLVAAAVRWRDDPRASRFAGCLAGIVAEYALIGIFRTPVTEDVTNYSRYTYVSAVLLIVGASAVVGAWSSRVHDGSAAVPKERRPLLVLAGGSLLALALTWNAHMMLEGRNLFGTAAAATRAFVAVGLERPLPPGTDPEKPFGLVPAPAALGRIVARYGSPLGDTIAPDFVVPISPALRAEARRQLAVGAATPSP